MRKDYKTGLLVGLVFVALLMGWVATRQNLSIESRILNDDIATPEPDLVTVDTSFTKTQPAVETPAPAVENKEPEKKFYIVQKGDTLSGISAKFYGTVTKSQKIHEANKDTVKDPTSIKPGMQLIIPD